MPTDRHSPDATPPPALRAPVGFTLTEAPQLLAVQFRQRSLPSITIAALGGALCVYALQLVLRVAWAGATVESLGVPFGLLVAGGTAVGLGLAEWPWRWRLVVTDEAVEARRVAWAGEAALQVPRAQVRGLWVARVARAGAVGPHEPPGRYALRVRRTDGQDVELVRGLRTGAEAAFLKGLLELRWGLAPAEVEHAEAWPRR